MTNNILYSMRMEDFCKSLETNESIIKASEFYKRSISDVIKAIQIRICTKGDRDGNTTKIWVAFTDLKSGIKINQVKNY